MLQSNRQTLLLLCDQRAAAEQSEVRLLGGKHREFNSLNVFKPDVWTLQRNENLFQVPLELESPTQISLVDEASGEVRFCFFILVCFFNQKMNFLWFNTDRLCDRNRRSWWRCFLQVTVPARSCESKPPETLVDLNFYMFKSEYLNNEVDLLKHQFVFDLKDKTQGRNALFGSPLWTVCALKRSQVPVWGSPWKRPVHRWLQVGCGRRVQDGAPALRQQVSLGSQNLQVLFRCSQFPASCLAGWKTSRAFIWTPRSTTRGSTRSPAGYGSCLFTDVSRTPGPRV